MVENARLVKNENDRFQVGDIELSSGAALEIKLNGNWVLGRIEYVDGEYSMITAGQQAVLIRIYEGLESRVP